MHTKRKSKLLRTNYGRDYSICMNCARIELRIENVHSDVPGTTATPMGIEDSNSDGDSKDAINNRNEQIINATENGKNKLWQCIFGFNLLALSLLMLTFFVAMAITVVILTNNAYNSTAVDDWILMGGITSSSATFRVRMPRDKKERILIVSSSEEAVVVGQEGDRGFEAIISAVDDQLVQTIDVSNLDSSTQYYYRLLKSDSSNTVIRMGSFKTPVLEGQPMNFTIATAGCAWTGSKHEVFNIIAKKEPFMLLQLGDFHYEDIDNDDFDERIHAIDKVMGSPSQANLYSRTGLVYMWDDHDWLGNDSGGMGVGRTAALDSYHAAFPYYPLPATANAVDGDIVSPYHAFTIGTVRFIILDLRSQSSSTSIYSDEQKSWLFDELANARNYDFVVLVSSKYWVGPESKDEDSWLGHAQDRRELSTYITQTVASTGNLLMVSSDAHMVGFDDGSNTYYGTNRSLTDVPSFPILQSGPFDRFGSAKGGPYSDGCVTVSTERNHQYSIIEFEIPDGEHENQESCLQITSFDSSEKAIFSKRLCGNIFQSNDNAGTGSCEEQFLSTKSNIIGGFAAGFLGVIMLTSFYFIGVRKGFQIFSIVAAFGCLDIMFGVLYPLLKGITQFHSFEILLLLMLQMVMVSVYVLCWVTMKEVL